MDSGDLSTITPSPPPAAPSSLPQTKVNPYSVIDITPLQPQLLEQNHSNPPAESGEPDSCRVPSGVTSGYSIPVPCGYATPSGVPLITPAYSTPVIIRHLSVEEDGTVEPVELL